MKTDSVTEIELERLRVYLREWVHWHEQYQPNLGMPGVSAFAKGSKTDTATASEYLERSDKWAMEVIDTGIEDLSRLPDGAALRAALRNRLLNESVGARVFRHNRLDYMTLADVDAVADLAERELVLILKRKGLPLG